MYVFEAPRTRDRRQPFRDERAPEMNMSARDLHAVRIVPMRPFGARTLEEAPLSGRQLTYRNGPLLSAAEIFTIFWGAAWSGAQAHLAGQINAFFQYIVASPLIDQLGEYSRPGLAIGHGTFVGTQTIANSEPGASISDDKIQSFLTKDPVAKRAWTGSAARSAKAVSNRLVFLYLPPGTVVTMGGSASCTGFCGYHNDIKGKRFYGAMPFPSCAGCSAGLSTLDALTLTSSHELCEAITDPIPGTGWYNDQYGEIGDICPWETKKLGACTVQKEWSNAANACV